MASHLAVYSSDRRYGTPSEFSVEIPRFHGRAKLVLLNANIPNTLYNIRADNATVYWSRAATDYSAELPYGAYGMTDLLPVLEATMLTADAAGGYTVAYSTVTMKLTVTSTDATFYMRASERDLAAWDSLGWKTETDSAAGLAQTADSVLRLDFPAHLLIDVGLPGADVVNTAWKRGNFIVPMDVISQYNVLYNQASTFDQAQGYEVGSGKDSLDVRLLRPDGTVADLNGGEWSFVVGIAPCKC